MDTTDRINEIFKRLDDWRDLPAYQLERRADIFFSLYLKEVLEKELGKRENKKIELHEVIIPEFPIKKKGKGGRESNQSNKLDYVLFARDRSKVYFVELKTDSGSWREKQDKYLNNAQIAAFAELLKDLTKIAIKTNEKQKYYRLLKMLACLGFLNLPSDIEDYLYPKPKRGLKSCFEKIAVTGPNPPIEIVYVLPRMKQSHTCIDFKQFAEVVKKYDDSISKRFAESLECWAETKAGAPATMPPT